MVNINVDKPDGSQQKLTVEQTDDGADLLVSTGLALKNGKH